MQDRASAHVKALEKSLENMGGAGANAGQQLSRLPSILGAVGRAATVAAAGGVAALVGLGVAGAKMAGDLQQSVANISTIKPEIDTSGVFNSLNEMQRRVPQSAQQLGDSLYNVFSSVDVSVSDGLALVEKFARGAVGAGTSAETFGTAALGVMNAYKLSVAEADHISDVFFNTVNRGVVTGQELAANLGPVTQSAKAVGLSLDELGGFLVGVTKEGGPAAENINNLNNFLQKVSTTEAQKEIKALGVATTDSAGNFRPMVDILTELKPKLADMTEAARTNALQKIFPDAQARIGAQTILSQLDAVKDAIEVNQTSTGAAASAYEKMSATFNAQTTILKNTFLSLLTTIGANVLPLITPLIAAFAEQLPGAFATLQTKVTEFLPDLLRFGAQVQAALVPALQAAASAFRDFISGDVLPKIQAFGAFLTGTLIPAFSSLAQTATSALGPALKQTIGFIADHKEILAGVAIVIGGAMVAAFASWAVAAGAAAVATIAATGPVILIGGAIALLVAGIITLVKNWDELTQRFPILGTISDAVGSALRALADYVTGTFIPAWTEVISLVWDKVQPALSAVADWITSTGLPALRDLGSVLVDVAGAAFRTVADIVQAAWPVIQQVVTAVLGVIVPLVSNQLTIMKNAVLLIMNVLKGDWSAAWDNLKTIVKTAFDSMDIAVKAGRDLLVAAIKELPGLITAALGALGSLLYQHGVDLVQGLINGIKSKAGEVASAAADLGRAALDALNPFGRSPWPDMFAHGADAGEGFALGIASKLPQVQAMAKALGLGAVAKTREMIGVAKQAGTEIGDALGEAEVTAYRAWVEVIRAEHEENLARISALSAAVAEAAKVAAVLAGPSTSPRPSEASGFGMVPTQGIGNDSVAWLAATLQTMAGLGSGRSGGLHERTSISQSTAGDPYYNLLAATGGHGEGGRGALYTGERIDGHFMTLEELLRLILGQLKTNGDGSGALGQQVVTFGVGA